MADLRELMTDAKRLYVALEDLTEKQDQIRKDDIDLKEIWQSAKNRPFKNHILSGQEYSICRKYLGMLSCIVALSDDGKRRTIQIRFMARILSACYGATENDIRELLIDGMLLNEKGIEEFHELENKDLQIVLAVDMLILCYLCGDPEEKQLDFAVGFMAMLGLDRDTVKAIGMIAKGILEQDDSAVLGQMKYAPIDQFYCYMKNPPEGIAVIGDFSELESVESDKVMLVNANIQNVEGLIDLDNFCKKEIIFDGCCFTQIFGIRADKTKVEFHNCKFYECRQNNTFLLQISKGGVYNTIFENCYAKNDDTSYDGALIRLIDAKMKNCRFLKCRVESFSQLYRACGQLVLSINSCIENTIFEDCVMYGKTVREWKSIRIYVINAMKSTIVNNVFKSCRCEKSGSNDFENYILLCDNHTSSKDNTFEECSSSQSGDKYELIGRIEVVY